MFCTQHFHGFDERFGHFRKILIQLGSESVYVQIQILMQRFQQVVSVCA